MLANDIFHGACTTVCAVKYLVLSPVASTCAFSAVPQDYREHQTKINRER